MQINILKTENKMIFNCQLEKNKYCALVLFFICAFTSFSQEIKLTGIVKDSIGNTLESANVIAFNKETNKLKSYSVSNSKGEYKVQLDQGVKYTLKVSFIGFKTISFDIDKTTFKESAIKNFTLYEETNSLDEVVLVYEMPIHVKKDTIVYNAPSFLNGTEKKLSDILKKLPGVEINSKGQIEVEGKQVMKVTVEGKDFFDGDSKLAAENIPSNAVHKIEVLKNFSEVSQLKSVANNEDNIVINLKLKEGKKNFWFGELTAGVGLDNSYLLHPKLFYYSPAKSVNILTDINNIGEIPFTFHDYINFTGGGNTDYGAPIVATHSGQVSFVESSNTGSGGRYIEITSPDGSFKTRYLHLSTVAVWPGQEINEGQTIGLLGGSGYGLDKSPDKGKTGYVAHLHYEIYRNGSPINPLGNNGNPIDPQSWIPTMGPHLKKSINNDSSDSLFSLFLTSEEYALVPKAPATVAASEPRAAVSSVSTITPSGITPLPVTPPSVGPIVITPPSGENKTPGKPVKFPVKKPDSGNGLY